MKHVKGGVTYSIEPKNMAGGIIYCRCMAIEPYSYFLGANPEGTASQTQTAITNCSSDPMFKRCNIWY